VSVSVLVRRVLIVLSGVIVAVGLLLPAGGTRAIAAATGAGHSRASGPVAATDVLGDGGPLAPLRAPGSSGDDAQIAAAMTLAKSTGKPTVVAALTTPTSVTSVLPSGQLSTRQNVLPVRVRQVGAWVPVSTALRTAADGSLTAAAVPGDSVSFSGGGAGPLARITVNGAQLALSWPGRLPAPVISGSSATYRGVLPGVDLVMTATAAEAGGLTSVLVVHDQAAARKPALAALALAVSGQGIGTVAVTRDGRFHADAPRAGGSFTAEAPVMWDSAALPVSSPRAVIGAHAAADRAVGGFIAGPARSVSGASSAAGPATGARMAPVTMSIAAGRRLALAPDAAMLAARSTVYPVFIDPSVNWITAGGAKLHYDDVQSACPAEGHLDSSLYVTLGVGFDAWDDCGTGGTGTDYALYEVTLPSAAHGAHICASGCATLDTFETYSAGCTPASTYTADVTLSLTSALNTSGNGTSWNTKPATTGNAPVKSVPPDAKTDGSGNFTNCHGSEDIADSSQWVEENFDVKSLVTSSAGNAFSWGFATFRLWEQGSPSSNGFKRFSRNPTLQLKYNYTPGVPSGEQASASQGSGSVGCVTSAASAPVIGKSALNGPWLTATFNDPDGDTLQATFRYWNNSVTPIAYHTVSAGSNVTGARSAQIPGSFITGLSNGQVVGWQAQAQDGAAAADGGPFTSNWSAPCYFAVNPNVPDPPTVTGSPASTVPVGSTMALTLGSTNPQDLAVEFVWGLDNPPPASNPPAAQTCTTAASSPCRVSSSGTATLSVSVPSPGPHVVWVYAIDGAGNATGTTDGLPTGTTVTFTGAADVPPATYASFSAALASPADGNQMISDSSTGSGDANGDGGTRAFPYPEVEAAGWQPNGHVTIDGASFALPGFAAHVNDNVLAEGQTITMSGSGNALVFLTASTQARAAMFDDVATTVNPDSGELSSDLTVPYVPGGTGVTGSDCTLAGGTDINLGGCVAASGEVIYASGCSVPSQRYFLTVPDWTSGPADISVLQVPHDVLSNGNSESKAPKLYAFAVPLQSGCQVTSVTLPDVSASVNATVASGVTYHVPALHVFGMSLRNTVTATPAPDGSQALVTATGPAQAAWTPAFASPVEHSAALSGSATWSNQSIRMGVSAGVAAAAGAQVRIRLEDPMFQAGDVGAPLLIGAATIGLQSSSNSPTPASGTALQPLAFASSASVLIPEGGDVYSDPVALPWPVSVGQALLVTLYLKNGASGTGVPAAVPLLPTRNWASGVRLWDSAVGSGDKTGDTSGTPFTGSGSNAEGSTVHILGSVDVTEPVTAATPQGTPAVVVAGSNVVRVSGATMVSDGPPDFPVAGKLAAVPGVTYSAADVGIEGNQVLAGGDASGGVSLLSRLDRDILAEPDVGTVIINEGLQDVLGGAAPGDLLSAYASLATELSVSPGFGVTVIVADLTPCGGNSLCTAAVDGSRTAVNTAVDGSGLPTVVTTFPALFDGVIANTTTTPESLLSGDGGTDDVNLTQAGYNALAGVVPTFDFPTIVSPLP
jgi:hypothetical protein